MPSEDVNMTMAPPPIRTDYSLKPGVHMAKVEPEIMGEHAVVLQKLQEDDMATAWRARITGPQAAKAVGVGDGCTPQQGRAAQNGHFQAL